MPFLALLFAIVAMVYASVGFGGGSTYSALLALTGVDYRLIPVIALLCNIIVVTGGCYRFIRADLLDWRQVLPMIAISAPLAFIGGMVQLEEASFYLLLGSALFLSSLALLVPVPDWGARRLAKPVLYLVSGLIGLVAGLSGIGGGIFMSPVLHLIRWSEARRIAAFASFYILINSITGLAGQLIKGEALLANSFIFEYWPLMLGVLIGGQLGSYMGLKLLSPLWLRRLTALLVGYVAIRLLLRAVQLI